MQQKKSFCNRALIVTDWYRFWPFVLVYTMVLLVVVVFPANNYMSWMMNAEQSFRASIFWSMQKQVIISFCAGCGLAMMQFSYLMSRKSIDTMHAIPVTREVQFMSHIISGISMLTAGNLLGLLGLAGLQAHLGVSQSIACLQWFVLAELDGLFFFAFAVLAAMLTGWLLAVPIIFCGLNVVIIALETLVKTIAAYTYYGWSFYNYSVLAKWLTPVYSMIESAEPHVEYITGQSYNIYSIGAHAMMCGVFYGILALILIAVALVLYRFRCSESTGSAIVFSWLRPIVRWGISFCGGLGFAVIAYEMAVTNKAQSISILWVLTVIFASFFSIAVEMLYEKRFKVFKDKQTWTQYGILAISLIAVFAAISLDVTGFQKRVPNAEDIESVSLYTNLWDGRTNHNEDPELIDLTAEMHRAFVDRGPIEENYDGFETMNIIYTLKNGKELTRTYHINIQHDAGTPLAETVNRVINDPAMKNGYEEAETPAKGTVILGGNYSNYQYDPNSYVPLIDENIMLSPEQAEKLLDAYREDISVEGDLDLADYTYYGTASLNIYCDALDDHGFQKNFYVNIHRTDMYNVIRVLLEEGIINSEKELFAYFSEADGYVAEPIRVGDISADIAVG